MPHGDLGGQPLEPHPAGRAGPGLAQVVVDHQHPGGRPAQRDRPLDQSILQPGRLAMVEHLLTGGLAHVHHRQPLKMALVHLAAQPLPRQQRGHGRPPSPAGAHMSAPAGPASGTTATIRLASTASDRTAVRRLASGSSAQDCLVAHCGARVFPRRPRRLALLATRAGSQPFDDLDQPQQPLTSEYRRLSYLVIIHECIVVGRLRRPSSRPRARSAWTTTKSASTRPGTGTSPWPWSRWRSWPSPAPAFLMPTTGSGGGRGDRAGRAGRALRRRAASAAGLPGLAPTGRPGVHPRLVDLAPPSSSHPSTHPLPATTHKTATVGLGLASTSIVQRS